MYILIIFLCYDVKSSNAVLKSKIKITKAVCNILRVYICITKINKNSKPRLSNIFVIKRILRMYLIFFFFFLNFLRFTAEIIKPLLVDLNINLFGLSVSPSTLVHAWNL